LHWFIPFALTVALSLLPIPAHARPAEDAYALNQQGMAFMNKGDYKNAAQVLERSAELYRKALGPNHPFVAKALRVLALVYHLQHRNADAEPLLQRSLAIEEKVFGVGHPNCVESLEALVVLYNNEGRFADAEAVYKRALAAREKVYGPDHPYVANMLNRLAVYYNQTNNAADALPLLQRALAITERVYGSDHLETAELLNNLGLLYADEGRYADAEALYKRSLAIQEKAHGPDDRRVAEVLNNLALAYKIQKRFAEAEPLYQRSLAIKEKARSPEHPDVGRDPEFAQSLRNLGNFYLAQGRYDDAEPLYRRAMAIDEKIFGPDSWHFSLNLDDLALVHDGQGKHAEAVAASRRAIAIMTRHLALSIADRSGTTASFQKGSRTPFINLLHVLSRAPSVANGPTPDVVDEAFRAAQYAGGLETARALASTTARYAAGSDALAALMRHRQDLYNRRRKLDADLLAALSQPSDRRNPNAEASSRSELAEIDAKLQRDDERLRAGFPRFAVLSAAEPVSVGDVQSLLDPGEVFVAFTLANEESYLFIIRKDIARFLTLAVKRAEVADSVSALRATLVADAQFDIVKAHDLYASLFGSAETLLADAKHLIIVPDGALQSLPPSILVTALPASAKRERSDYKSVAWLIRRQAVTVLPAASSLVSLRRFAEARQAKDPFAGFGDPDFKGDRGARGIKVASFYRGAEVDLDSLRRLPRLEETAGELRAEAKALGAPDSSVHLGSEASVTVVKRLDLSTTRVVAFATHGLIAGDLPQLAEPALVLSPPANSTPEDDGLLRASQVSQLKLNADFVILSACNTAAPDGKPGAEGLSGLAKAFFYAGARSILVSHWPVDSDATVKLTTGLIRAAAADPSIGRAEALRRSILAMIDNAPANSNDAHPALWAPFILAGEGGAKK
jgi:CHAT domain-containing protein/tetratricopeptide (TPR) repeat protein